MAPRQDDPARHDLGTILPAYSEGPRCLVSVYERQRKLIRRRQRVRWYVTRHVTCWERFEQETRRQAPPCVRLAPIRTVAGAAHARGVACASITVPSESLCCICCDAKTQATQLQERKLDLLARLLLGEIDTVLFASGFRQAGREQQERLLARLAEHTLLQGAVQRTQAAHLKAVVAMIASAERTEVRRFRVRFCRVTKPPWRAAQPCRSWLHMRANECAAQQTSI